MSKLAHFIALLLASIFAVVAHAEEEVTNQWRWQS
jgi:hypothetical protein